MFGLRYAPGAVVAAFLLGASVLVALPAGNAIAQDASAPDTYDPYQQDDASLPALAQEFLAFRERLWNAVYFPIDSAADVRHLLAYLHVEDEKRLVQSWFAYHAVVASETPAYIEGIGMLLQRHSTQTLLERLETENQFARHYIPGVDVALLRLQEEKLYDSLQLQRLTQSLLDASQAWKWRKWGSQEVKPADILPTALANLRVLLAHAGEIRLVREAHAEVYAPTDLILTLAARRILGANASKVRHIEHPGALQCLRWARLNLDQCMVTSINPSEEAWCAGTHGIEEVAACWRFLLPEEKQATAQ